MPATIINDYTITVDGLKLMVTSRPGLSADVNLLTVTNRTSEASYQAQGFTVEKEVSNNPAYHLKYGIMHQNQRLGTLYTDLTKKYGYNQHLRPLHVENEAFYTMDFANLLPQFLHAFGLEVHNESQLDISLETQQVDPSQQIQGYTNNVTEYQRIKRKNDRGLEINGTLDEVTGKMDYTTYINRNSKNVEVTIYNKTKELQDKGHKQYITARHEANGFDMSKSVYKLELSIKAKALNSYRPYAVTEDGEVTSVYKADNNVSSKASRHTETTSTNIEISKLNNPAYLCALFQQFFPVDIRRKDKTRATNCTRVELIDFTIYGQDEVNQTVTTKPTTNKLTMEKKRIQHDLIDFKTTGELCYLQVATSIAQRHQLTATLNQLIEKLKINEAVQTHGLQHVLEDFAIENRLHIAA